MKILLTGKPGVGKSSILKKVAADLKMQKYGIVAKEIKNGQGRRIGFEAISIDGKNRVFAHKSSFKTEFAVGEYYVDVEAINGFVVPELKKGLGKDNSVVFIDEIGRMQSFSAEFLKIIRDLFASGSNLLAAIVLEDEPWSLKFKKHPGVILIEVNTENREYLEEILEDAFSNTESYNKLSSRRQEFVNKLFNEFVVQNKFIQAKKLLKNAIVYVAQERAGKIFENSELVEYSVSGKTNKHKTVFYKAKNEYKCDCDLFNGKGEFGGSAGECSHIQTIRILNC